jgi:hypothetical protein
LVLFACSNNDGPTPAATPDPTPTATATALLTAVATPTPTPTPSATPTPTLATSVPPERDLFDLARRLVIKDGGAIPRVVNPEPVSYAEGRQDTFQVTDIQSREMHTVTATLRLVTEHAYWYMDNNVSFKMDALSTSANKFEEVLYPQITGVFGPELVPGIDNDVHLTILHTPLRRVAGYFSSSDEYPVQVHPHSNQREMIYIGSGLALDSVSYMATLAHEFTHAVQFRADPSEDSWVNEGLAELGKELAGYRPAFRESFLASQPTSLTQWPQAIASTIPYYGGANIFMEYLAHRFGADSLRLLMEEPADGVTGVERYLESIQAGVGFQEVFADWLLAIFLNAPQGGDYTYSDTQLSPPGTYVVQGTEEIAGELDQYSARYFSLPLDGPDVTVVFQGQQETPLLPVRPVSGAHCWWGNVGDSIDTTLTGQFSLPPVEPLELEYSIWYETESGWDFAYVEVSTNAGVTWDILGGAHTSREESLGNSFGPGYTGSSGGWLKERVDLTPYAGQDVMLRFEYVTDDAIHGPGICLDDISVPQTGLFDDAETDQGTWLPRGFVRAADTVPQGYILRLIEMWEETLVTDIPVAGDGSTTFTVKGAGQTEKQAILVVAAVAEMTTQPAAFELEVRVP